MILNLLRLIIFKMSYDLLLRTIKTPLGEMISGIHNSKIYFLKFKDGKKTNYFIKKLESSFTLIYDNNYLHFCKTFEKLQIELTEYFLKKRTQFTIPICLTGTSYQKKIWNSLLNIPYGNTLSYKEQGETINNKAYRSIGKINGENKISIIVPCHRVISSNNKLTGFDDKLWRKKELLILEKNNIKNFYT